MSIKVQSYVWEHSRARGSALLLLLAIADFAHDDGTGAWPSIDTLSKKCRQSARNVTYLLRKLEDAGELKTIINGGPHDSNAYAIPMGSAKIAPLDKAHAPDCTKPLQTSVDTPCKPARQIAPNPLGTIIEPPQQPLQTAAAVVSSKKKPPELPPRDEKAALTFQLYQQQIGIINPRLAELVREDIEDIPQDWIPLAFDRAATANVNKWSYIKGVLANWKQAGGPDIKKNGVSAPPDHRYARAWVNIYRDFKTETADQAFARLKREGKVEPDAVMWEGA